MSSLSELQDLTDVEIVDYALDMDHEDGSEESEYVYGRMADMIDVPSRGVETSIQD